MSKYRLADSCPDEVFVHDDGELVTPLELDTYEEAIKRIGYSIGFDTSNALGRRFAKNELQIYLPDEILAVAEVGVQWPLEMGLVELIEDETSE